MKKKVMSLIIAAGVLVPSADLVHASLGDDVINTGDNFLGKPYRYGSAFGNTSSFDCSSFTSYVFSRHGITLPRTSIGQASVGTPVSKANLQKGDLVFYDTNYDGVINHAGIYAGNGKMLNAQSSGGVQFTDAFSRYYWGARYVTARRVIKETPKPAVAAASTVTNTNALTHKVKQGETLYGISKKYKTTVANIQKLNGLKSTSLRAGQVLKLKAPAATPAKPAVKKTTPAKTIATKTYTVKAGDTLWGISKQFKVSVDHLVKVNQLKSTSISIGQKIKL
ncbi:C40 family peptidase [Fictibacillus phosphorivorans]|uniref:C40 family peptidase n=1 Tax=Fictibacillus phosphorivorans TaxID=1221500 RepID=UPI0011A31C90|nr:C40 family peptidase [Fictibacillus phosphorivorans]